MGRAKSSPPEQRCSTRFEIAPLRIQSSTSFHPSVPHTHDTLNDRRLEAARVCAVHHPLVLGGIETAAMVYDPRDFLDDT